MTFRSYRFRTSCYFVLFLLIGTYQTYSQQFSPRNDTLSIPKLESVVKIDKLLITNHDRKNGTLELSLPITSSIDRKVKLSITSEKMHLHYNKYNYRSTFEDEILLSKDKKLKSTFTLDPDKFDNILLSVTVKLLDKPKDIKSEYHRYFKIIRINNEFTVYDPLEKTNLKPIEIKPLIGELSSSKNGINTLTYNINISGKIKIATSNNLGVYGNGVSLFFRNSANPGTLYHPLLNHIRNVHYDLLDNQGNFHFNFTFNGSLTGYNQVIVIVNTANQGAYLPAPADGYVVWEDNAYKTYFNESEGIIATIDANNPNISILQDGYLNYHAGTLLRYMMLSRDFTLNIYNGNLPFYIHPVLAYINQLQANYAGVFITSSTEHHIEIDPDYTDPTTICHEYGHYVNFSMWSSNYSKFRDVATDLKEGWAIFYSWGAKSYIARSYNDVIDTWDDNVEIAPYEFSPRFHNIRYARSYPTYAAISCYLWNLFDNSYDSNIELSDYSGDNDDISGYSSQVFETMRNFLFTTFSDYHSFFRDRINALDVPSVNDIYSFLFDDLYNMPVHKMRPPQVRNLAKTRLSSTQLQFTWNSQSYSNSRYYGNYETGYNLYFRNGASWQLTATIPYGQNSYTYSANNINKEYKLTSYNSAGESTSPLTIPTEAPNILSFSQNPSPIIIGSYGYVYAVMSYNDDNITYTWTSSDLPSGAYITPMGSYCKVTYPSVVAKIGISSDPHKSITPIVTLTATNTFGTSIRTYNLNFSTVSGCPTLAFMGKDRLLNENPLLVKSIDNPNTDVVDYYMINTPIKCDNDINFIIHEPENEHTYLDQVELLELKNDDKINIAVDDQGNLVSYKVNEKIKILLNGNQDVTVLLSEKDNNKLQLKESDILTIIKTKKNSSLFDKADYLNEPDYFVGTGGGIIIKDSPVGKFSSSKGKSGDINMYFRPNESTSAFEVPLNSDTVLITFAQDIEMDFLALVKNQKLLHYKSLKMDKAFHSQEGDVKLKLAFQDQQYTEIFPGQRIEFSFKPESYGKDNRNYILKTIGRYNANDKNKISTIQDILLPSENYLFENYPNPFNPNTTISFNVKQSSQVKISVYDIIGRLVETLVNEVKEQGHYTINFNASKLASGTYFYEMQTAGFRVIKKMIVIK